MKLRLNPEYLQSNFLHSQEAFQALHNSSNTSV